MRCVAGIQMRLYWPSKHEDMCSTYPTPCKPHTINTSPFFTIQAQVQAMATCAAPTRVIAGIPSLKSATKASIRSQDEGGSSRVFFNKTKYARGAARTTCADASIIISLSTGASLFLGRFVFLPIQREQIAKAGLPQQNGVTHFEAGDTRAQEVSSLLQTNDPAGFTIVDVLAWGSIGHIVAYFILATASNGYEPQF